jgi:hypothetical protein
MSELLTLVPDDFTPHVGKVFHARNTSHALTLTRVEQRQLAEWENRELGLRQPFNLIFRGPPGDVLAEGMYTMDVEGGPSFELYMIPIHTPQRDRQNYQSAFN